jgi:hypothetical protein
VWFKQHLAALHTWLTPAQCVRLAQFIKENWGKSFSASLARMATLDALMVPYALERILKQRRVRGVADGLARRRTCSHANLRGIGSGHG